MARRVVWWDEAERERRRRGGFVTIWVGNRVVWKGPEDEIPPRFRDGDDLNEP